MKILTTISFVFISWLTLGQGGYKIDFKIKGLKDTIVLLGYYNGESTYVRDTAKVDHLGTGTFDGKKRLPQGTYFFVLGKARMFDLMISEQQQFSLETSREDYVKYMKVKGDEDNQIFYENLMYNAERIKERDPLIKILQDSSSSNDQKKLARESLQKLNEKVMTHQDEIILKYPTTLTARLLKATKPVNVPDAPVRANGSIDSTFQLRYYRKHFFDNFDLADDALLRLPRPFYTEKLDEYLDKLFLQTPDSLMAAIDELAARVKKNQETYKFLVWNCIYKYQKPTIMGLDEVYVRLTDKYYTSGEMDFWIDAKTKKSMQEYADKLRVSLIGKTGENLIMQDQNFQKKSMYDITSKYTILFIFNPDCGHCKEETPKLVEFYTKNKTKLSVEVFAVSTDTSMQKMRDYIKTMKMNWITVNGPRTYVGVYTKYYYAEVTPSLYIIDSKRKIIAKGIPADKVEDFFINYERYLQRKPGQKAKGT